MTTSNDYPIYTLVRYDGDKYAVKHDTSSSYCESWYTTDGRVLTGDEINRIGVSFIGSPSDGPPGYVIPSVSWLPIHSVVGFCNGHIREYAVKVEDNRWLSTNMGSFPDSYLDRIGFFFISSPEKPAESDTIRELSPEEPEQETITLQRVPAGTFIPPKMTYAFRKENGDIDFRTVDSIHGTIVHQDLPVFMAEIPNGWYSYDYVVSADVVYRRVEDGWESIQSGVTLSYSFMSGLNPTPLVPKEKS